DLTAQTEQLARELATQASTLDELNGLLRGLMKSALQRMLDTEMDVHLGRKDPPVLLDGAADRPAPPDALRNRRNGRSNKTVQGEPGAIPLHIPRARRASLEP